MKCLVLTYSKIFFVPVLLFILIPFIVSVLLATIVPVATILPEVVILPALKAPVVVIALEPESIAPTVNLPSLLMLATSELPEKNLILRVTSSLNVALESKIVR